MLEATNNIDWKDWLPDGKITIAHERLSDFESLSSKRPIRITNQSRQLGDSSRLW